MKKNNLKYKQIILENIKKLNKNNLAFSLFLIAIAMLYSLSNQSNLIKTLQEKDKQLTKISSYVTYITDAGVVKQYERQTFDVFNEKQNVENVLSRYLVQSAYNLTDGYKRAYYANNKDLFKNTKDFIDFYANYIHINKNSATQKEIKENKKVQRDWEQILSYFTMMINQNDLPQIIDKKTSDIKTLNWETNGENFSISFTLPLYAKSRNKNDAIDEGITYAQIIAKGYFNLFDKTTLNPRGMKFTALKLLHPAIDQSKKKEGKQ